MSLLKHAHLNALKRNLGQEEAEVLIEFVNTNLLRGYFYTRVPLCAGHVRIDVVCVLGEKPKYPVSVYGNLQNLRRRLLRLRGVSAWVIEIKKELNFEALGQILVDKYYFPKEYPDIRVEGYGILCEEEDEIIEIVCKYHGVQVFKV